VVLVDPPQAARARIGSATTLTPRMYDRPGVRERGK
jgi:hypothetical protein